MQALWGPQSLVQYKTPSLLKGSDQGKVGAGVEAKGQCRSGKKPKHVHCKRSWEICWSSQAD
jgi:hypothetical protein